MDLDDVSRVASPSPSGGSMTMHEQEQGALVTTAIDGAESPTKKTTPKKSTKKTARKKTAKST